MAQTYDHPYSELLDRTKYDVENLCEGIDLRRHLAGDLEDVGAFRAQEDWRRLVGPLENPYRGGLGPQFSFITIAVPDCLPDRLEVVSYGLELGFMHDDVIDQNIDDADLDEMEKGLNQGSQTGDIDDRGSGGKRKMAAQVLREMMAIDPERAMVVAKSWAAGVQHSARREEETNFKTLEEYIPYRALDVGYMLWHGLVTFGCAITVTDEELPVTKELLGPALITASLTNDLYSFEKEKNDANCQNAVLIVMKEHNCSEEEARERLKKRIRVEVAKYVQTVKDTKTRSDLSDEVKRYVDVMQYTLSGNCVWSRQCPRYHMDSQWNELQMLRAQHGVAKYPARWPPNDGTDGFGNKRSIKPAQNGVNGQKRKRNGVENGTNGVKKAKPSTNGSLEMNDALSLALGSNLADLSDDVVLQPFRYLVSLPSKGFRDQAIDSINTWLKVPVKQTVQIKKIIQLLHSASLLLDDIEDDSPLRRGKPSTHEIYGNAQTINSATYQYIEATALTQRMNNAACFDIFVEEMKQLYIGQSYDLYWTHNTLRPSVSEYLKMIDMKTGGLFRMLTRMMVAVSPVAGKVADKELNPLSCHIGRFFQIRDDYKNLASADYAAKKGFAEDLDEGKYSFTLIHCLETLESEPRYAGDLMQLRALLVKRRVDGKLSNESKREILGVMDKTGSLEYTLEFLRALHGQVEGEVKRLETTFGKENFELRLLLEMLKV